MKVVLKIALTLLFFSAFFSAIASCGSDSDSNSGTTDSTNPKTSTEETKDHPIDSFFLATLPADAIEVSALRELDSGVEVTVRGDVQEYAPVQGKAVLSLYDHALLSCDEKPDDACQTPWDFCCVDAGDIAKASALVEFRKDGKIVNADLKGFHGIDHLSDVVITGTLHLDDAGNARIVANGLHVE